MQDIEKWKKEIERRIDALEKAVYPSSERNHISGSLNSTIIPCQYQNQISEVPEVSPKTVRRLVINAQTKASDLPIQIQNQNEQM